MWQHCTTLDNVWQRWTNSTTLHNVAMHSFSCTVYNVTKRAANAVTKLHSVQGCNVLRRCNNVVLLSGSSADWEAAEDYNEAICVQRQKTTNRGGLLLQGGYLRFIRWAQNKRPTATKHVEKGRRKIQDGENVQWIKIDRPLHNCKIRVPLTGLLSCMV